MVISNFRIIIVKDKENSVLVFFLNSAWKALLALWYTEKIFLARGKKSWTALT
jgi:hypothetical protein